MLALGAIDLCRQLGDARRPLACVAVGKARRGRRLAAAVLVGQHRHQPRQSSRPHAVEQALTQAQHRQQVALMKDSPQAVARLRERPAVRAAENVQHLVRGVELAGQASLGKLDPVLQAAHAGPDTLGVPLCVDECPVGAPVRRPGAPMPPRTRRATSPLPRGAAAAAAHRLQPRPGFAQRFALDFQRSGPLADAAIGPPLSERPLQQFNRGISRPAGDEVGDHVVRRPEGGLQLEVVARREPCRLAEGRLGVPQRVRVAHLVDPATAGAARELGVLARRQQCETFSPEPAELFDHH